MGSVAHCVLVCVVVCCCVLTCVVVWYGVMLCGDVWYCVVMYGVVRCCASCVCMGGGMWRWCRVVLFDGMGCCLLLGDGM